jgi:predicted HTH transcriptional regulator
MNQAELATLLENLVKLNKESEWLELKLNFHSSEEIGERISALSNGACMENQPNGYLVFGVKNDNQTIEGTTFKAKTKKVKRDDLEHWLAQRLTPRIDFTIYEFDYNGKHISLFEIPAAERQPTEFNKEAYIRVASITRKLREFPEKERKIWRKEKGKPFEKEIALNKVSTADIVSLLDTQGYFDLMKLPYPSNREAVLEKFISEKFVVNKNANYDITNLGALLFAKDLKDFPTLTRKAARVIVYKDRDKLDTIKDTFGVKGYVIGFKGLVDYINDQLPQNEEISKIIRDNVKMYPERAVRELVANALVHQDFQEKGNPVFEIFSDRIEFTNPGLPVITPARFIDEYQSRNEIIADIMRRVGVCEEKGSGIDKVIGDCEVFQLPAPNILTQERHTKVIMYAHQTLNEMSKEDKIRACYQHCCLKYVSNQKMTNQTLRERFKIEEQNAATASRILKDTKNAEFIKDEDPTSKSRKFSTYIPFWA